MCSRQAFVYKSNVVLTCVVAFDFLASFFFCYLMFYIIYCIVFIYLIRFNCDYAYFVYPGEAKNVLCCINVWPFVSDGFLLIANSLVNQFRGGLVLKNLLWRNNFSNKRNLFLPKKIPTKKCSSPKRNSCKQFF